jgi:peptide/nickel transport system substrate-binding protein
MNRLRFGPSPLRINRTLQPIRSFCTMPSISKRSARRYLVLAAALMGTSLASGAALAQSELRIGMRDDPGSLDPATNATFVGRVSLQSICDKLVDIDAEGNLVPMLAESWEWNDAGTEVTLKLRQGVVFHDGTPLDAEAVRYTLDRYKTLEGSRRAAELGTIASVEVIDPATVKLVLSSPSVSLLTQLTDRAGMIVSPTAAAAMSADAFAAAPVCAGPYTLAEYLPQERVVLEKFADHWRADEYSFDRVIFQAIPDTNVRLLNLRSGDLDLAENIAPNDIPSIESDAGLKVAIGDQPAYEMILFNLNGPGADADVAAHPELREAFSLGIDREAINQVVFGGRYTTGNQPFPPSSPWYNQDFPVPARDVEAAKAKLAEAGLDGAEIDLMISTSPERAAVAEMMQAMLSEVGITLNINPTEFVAMRQQASEGNFEAYVIGSSGRVDPDLNISLVLQSGTANNAGRYSSEELDALLAKGRATSDQAARKAIYDEAMAVIMRDMPGIYLYNQRAAYAMKSGVEGFVPYPDGIIRLQGVSFSQ